MSDRRRPVLGLVVLVVALSASTPAGECARARVRGCDVRARVRLLAAASKTIHPPCCRDTLSQVTCQRLQKVNGTFFAHRCNGDVEFR